MRLFGEIHYGEYIPLYNVRYYIYFCLYRIYCDSSEVGINLLTLSFCQQYLPGKAKAQSKVQQNRQEMFEFYQTLIDEHRATLDMDNARDLIDVYLIEIEKAKIEGTEGELFEGRDHGKHFYNYE